MSDNEIEIKQNELDELKREMRSAQWVEWVERNQKGLISLAAAVLVVLVATGFWIENQRAQVETAANAYQQALNQGEASSKIAMLEGVSRDFPDSSYAVLALMQLAGIDAANAVGHLQNLIAHPGATDEWVWQAQLDLASLYLERGDAAAARAELEKQVGKQYQQLRYFLLAQASESESDKRNFLQQALDADVSASDPQLKRKIELQLGQQAS